MRLDSYIAETYEGITRSRAQAIIKSGGVSIDGRVILKPSYQLEPYDLNNLSVKEDIIPYVSRGGLKLAAALEAFSVDPIGRICADIGSSTGGFTDCLLQNGAVKVFAVDSGSDQLAQKLKSDRRVVSIEKFNARELTADTFGELCSLAVCDLSFISQTYVLPAISSVLQDGADYIGLIKPQFECGREALGGGGIIRHPKYYFAAVKRVFESAESCCLKIKDLIRSPIKGGDGNIEFLFHAVKFPEGEDISCTITDEDIKRILA